MCLLVVRLYMRLRRVGHQSPPHTRYPLRVEPYANSLCRSVCTGPPSTSYKFGGYNRAQAGTG